MNNIVSPDRQRDRNAYRDRHRETREKGGQRDRRRVKDRHRVTEIDGKRERQRQRQKDRNREIARFKSRQRTIKIKHGIAIFRKEGSEPEI